MRGTLLSVIGLTGAFAAGPAAAQVAATFVEAPSREQVAAAFPAKAKADGQSGVVALSCTAAMDGRLKDCVVIGEEPRGKGFGAAARQLARSMRVAGARSGDEVRVPVNFSADVLKADFTAKTPKWTAMPSTADFQATIPKHEGGPNAIRVTLVCDVQAGGALSGCTVDREEPAGQGFGQGVLALASKFKVEPWSAEGLPTVGAKVRLPVRYDLKPVDQASR
ncbi:TonB family protein [Phenylobacterium sp.]|uniref:TonB family protein n=1 Tax=Phenylobacterium sp. TaxID=1871053 RepID=UPI002811A44B|nr:TonB family protein [Phenylobacterium sp.]